MNKYIVKVTTTHYVMADDQFEAMDKVRHADPEATYEAKKVKLRWWRKKHRELALKFIS